MQRDYLYSAQWAAGNAVLNISLHVKCRARYVFDPQFAHYTLPLSLLSGLIAGIHGDPSS